VLFCCREEELQAQKRKRRRVKGDSRLSFVDDIENESDEEEADFSTLFPSFASFLFATSLVLFCCWNILLFLYFMIVIVCMLLV
jgi:hypothetical protein